MVWVTAVEAKVEGWPQLDMRDMQGVRKRNGMLLGVLVRSYALNAIGCKFFSAQRKSCGPHQKCFAEQGD